MTLMVVAVVVGMVVGMGRWRVVVAAAAGAISILPPSVRILLTDALSTAYSTNGLLRVGAERGLGSNNVRSVPTHGNPLPLSLSLSLSLSLLLLKPLMGPARGEGRRAEDAAIDVAGVSASG